MKIDKTVPTFCNPYDKRSAHRVLLDGPPNDDGKAALILNKPANNFYNPYTKKRYSEFPWTVSNPLLKRMKMN